MFRGTARPLLKWAGGKRQLLPVLRRFYPPAFGRYIEPFLGSGAVFFDLHAAGHLEGCRVELSDLNSDLIGCYRTVRDHPEAVIAALRVLETEHRRHGDRCYYDVRDGRFNPGRFAANADSYPPSLAAMLIYLNRTGFNGLFRLNRNGAFNVPVGRYENPQICDAAHIHAVASVFGAPGVSIRRATFEETLAGARKGDFVYCDPPYAPVSRTSNFASYTAEGFAAGDQERLRDALVAAAGRGAIVLISNSSAPEIAAAYGSTAARAAGLSVYRIPARRAINARAERRGAVDELVITNAPLTRLRMARATVGRAAHLASFPRLRRA